MIHFISGNFGRASPVLLSGTKIWQKRSRDGTRPRYGTRPRDGTRPREPLRVVMVQCLLQRRRTGNGRRGEGIRVIQNIQQRGVFSDRREAKFSSGGEQVQLFQFSSF